MWIKRSITRVKCRFSRIVPLLSHISCPCRSLKVIHERSLCYKWEITVVALRDHCFEFPFLVDFIEYMHFRSIQLKKINKFLISNVSTNHLCNQNWYLNALKSLKGCCKYMLIACVTKMCKRRVTIGKHTKNHIFIC